MKSSSDTNIFAHLKSNWHIYTALFVVLSWGVSLEARTSKLEAKTIEQSELIKEHTVYFQKVETELTKMNVGLAQINTSLEWLKREH